MQNILIDVCYQNINQMNNRRVYPRIWDRAYLVLNELSKQIQEVIQKELKNKTQLSLSCDKNQTRFIYDKFGLGGLI